MQQFEIKYLKDFAESFMTIGLKSLNYFIGANVVVLDVRIHSWKLFSVKIKDRLAGLSLVKIMFYLTWLHLNSEQLKNILL